MSSFTATPAPFAIASPRGRIDRLLADAVTARLSGLREGLLTISDGQGERRFGAPAGDGLSALIRVHDPRFWAAVALRGSVGAGEAYAAGHWSADRLVNVVRLFTRNRDALLSMEGGLARLAAPLLSLAHALRRNTREGSRRNIADHYDLSNDFFRLILDETMTYSAGIFEREDATLAEASIAKIDRLCRKLDLGPRDHLLEIGTGWGALAIHAARRYGCRVTTTTISEAQRGLAIERVRAAGLEGRIEVLPLDYRDLTGTYSKLVSVEMIEAVGHQYFDAFFRVVSERLAPDGIAAIQAITIDDRLYESARDSVDFVKRHIFPGCCIPSLAVLGASMARASDLRLFHLEDLTPHYARTLAAWHRNLEAHRGEARALGFDEERLRAWAYYLAYCEGGFAERQLGVCQMVLTKPGCARPPILGPLEAPGRSGTRDRPVASGGLPCASS